MVVLKRTSVRASSVPVGFIGERSEPVSSYIADVSQNAAARRISNAARDDTDALMSASKRHDRELLSNINNRLANASYQQPVVVRRSSFSQQRNKPPLPPAAPAGRSTVTTTVHRYGVPAHRRYDDDDDDINLFPKTPVTTSVIRSARASSVPPRLSVVSPVLGRYSGPPPASGIYLTAVDGLVTPPTKVTAPWTGYGYRPVTRQMLHEYGLDGPSRYVVDNHKPTNLTPVADLAIKQAHRNLDRIDREIKFSSSDQPKEYDYYPQQSTYVEVDKYPLRHTTYRTAASPVGYYRGGVGGTTVRTTSLSPARGYSSSSSYSHQQPRRYVSPSPTRSPLLTTSGDVLIDGVMSPLAQMALIAPTAVENEIKSQLYKQPSKANIVDLQILPTDFYRTHTTNITPLTRSTYVPSHHVITSTPSRAYSVSSYTPPSAVHVTARSSVPPPPAPSHWDRPQTSLDSAPIPQPTSGRPKVSETRRKVREVLCKAKKDPHYFD